MVDAMTRAGNRDQAFHLADTILSQVDRIMHKNQQESVTIGLVKAIAATGYPDRAEAIIQSIATPGRQAEALVALSEIVQPSRVRTLLAQAVQLDRWAALLSALVKVQPTVREVVAVEVAGITASTKS